MIEDPHIGGRELIDKVLTTRPGWNHPPPKGVAVARERYPDRIEVKQAAVALPFPPRFELMPQLQSRFPQEPITIPEHFIARLPNARVFSYHGVVIDEEDDVMTDLTFEFGRFAKGSRVCHYEALPPVEEIDGRVLVLPSVSSWKNYFHWMSESVPRMRTISPDDYDFAVAPEGRPYHRNSLDLMGIPKEKRIAAKESTHIRARELIVPNPTHPGVTHRNGVEYIRRLAGRPPLANTTPGKRRIYVGRGDAWKRKILNETEVVAALKPLGIEQVHLDGLTIPEQAKLFADLELVVSPHGAALTNLMFSAPGTKVVECFPDQFVQAHFFRLAGSCGFEYFGHWTDDDPSQWHFDLHVESLVDLLGR
ncbi:MAG: glycosyltransferase family 61 protein [Verrucomicrobiota bacterium]